MNEQNDTKSAKKRSVAISLHQLTPEQAIAKMFGAQKPKPANGKRAPKK